MPSPLIRRALSACSASLSALRTQCSIFSLKEWFFRSPRKQGERDSPLAVCSDLRDVEACHDRRGGCVAPPHLGLERFNTIPGRQAVPKKLTPTTPSVGSRPSPTSTRLRHRTRGAVEFAAALHPLDEVCIIPDEQISGDLPRNRLYVRHAASTHRTQWFDSPARLRVGTRLPFLTLAHCAGAIREPLMRGVICAPRCFPCGQHEAWNTK